VRASVNCCCPLCSLEAHAGEKARALDLKLVGKCKYSGEGGRGGLSVEALVLGPVVE